MKVCEECGKSCRTRYGLLDESFFLYRVNIFMCWQCFVAYLRSTTYN